MKVPSKDYAIQYEELMPELLPELQRVLLEENPVLGKSVDAFEREFADYIGTDYAVGLNSGTDALYLALKSFGVKPGDEVITQANTFIATVSAIIIAGAIPVLTDPDPKTMNLSAEGLKKVMSPKTKAVIPVHLYGALCPMDEILPLCREKKLLVIEDAAQAHGVKGQDNIRAGAYGHAGCFSFHPSKNLGAFGDGGMITLFDKQAMEKLTIFRNLGKATKYDIHCVAPNSKLDTLQAALLRVKLKRLDAWNQRRQQIASIYRQELQNVGDLILPKEKNNVYHLFVVRTNKRDPLRAHLKTKGAKASLHYPIPPHLQKLDVDLGYKPGDFPVAEKLSKTILSLPVAPELKDEQVRYVCEQTRRFFE